jgi:hypothetical protein
MIVLRSCPFMQVGASPVKSLDGSTKSSPTTEPTGWQVAPRISRARMRTATFWKGGAVRLASIEWKANTELCRSLGVTRLPSVHYYQNGRKLAGFPAGPSKFQLVKDRLTYYQTLSKAELDFEANLEQGDMLISDKMKLAAKQQVQLPTKEIVTASAASLTTASSSSLSLTSTSLSNRNAGRFKRLWPKIFRRNT